MAVFLTETFSQQWFSLKLGSCVALSVTRSKVKFHLAGCQRRRQGPATIISSAGVLLSSLFLPLVAVLFAYIKRKTNKSDCVRAGDTGQ